MDKESVFTEFLAKEENAELRKIFSSVLGKSNETPQNNPASDSLGNVHAERQKNLDIGIESPFTAKDAVKPKYFTLDEVKDTIHLDGVEHTDSDLQWSQLALSPDLLRALQHVGFAKPSRIQQCALPLMLGSTRNIIAQAKNGSGKTATFSLAMLSKVDLNVPYIQAICLCPTRELATQNLQVIQKLGQFTQIKTFLGVPQCQPYDETNRYQLYVGTPGKTKEFFQKRIINTMYITMFVLDEADELINQENNMGPQVVQIRRMFRQPVQIVLFSATFSDSVYEFATRIAPNAHVIQVKREQLTLDCIDQRYMLCNDDEDKFKKLCEIYASMIVGQSVIFVNTKDSAFKLSQRMRDNGHAVSLLCGTLAPNAGPNSMTPEIRDRIMSEFKDGETKVLICTDVLARGIDVPQVTLVVNYDLPLLYSGTRATAAKAICMETYLHRIGRTGRFGVRGMAINMITVNEMALIDTIKTFYNCNVENLDCDPEAIEEMVRNFRV
ncbi:DEAD box ATP-dependent RNA helicase family member protein [Theileria equi strain WA]|uniref:RNA helicase n=1 Tax=Theileria equi strain WA TaxID=1537102 RepID=L0B0A1_THEEQ|nr:DEAD box ATP-dependent RNA helicase family member protein [Theileria equi strain WA]AFZ80564.1 DEAD box ATP-dependent RNA helicase family member protein [Theileria equi strain WA]|eukprot:XP_004830230.1 DEAD box ATP-dependent RNA helicase family member protein [Theileria equi strain WA]